MACNNLHLGIDQHWDDKSESADAAANLANLSGAAGPRIARVECQTLYRVVRYRDVPIFRAPALRRAV